MIIEKKKIPINNFQNKSVGYNNGTVWNKILLTLIHKPNIIYSKAGTIYISLKFLYMVKFIHIALILV